MGADDRAAGPAERRWQEGVRRHREQSERVRALAGLGEYTYEGRTDWFRDDPHRRDDPVLGALRAAIPVAASVLDVGGGAGRFAIPLALDGRSVTVVEPSAAMVETLAAGCADHGCAIPVIRSTWEDAHAPLCDVVLCANVVYGLVGIVPFVRKLEAHARERVLVLASMRSPLTQVSGLWQAVYGEPRAELPGVPELLDVLAEMKITPEVTLIDGRRSAVARSRAAAVGMIRDQLYIVPGSPAEERLEAALGAWLIETPEGYALRDAPVRRQALIAWTPGRG